MKNIIKYLFMLVLIFSSIVFIYIKQPNLLKIVDNQIEDLLYIFKNSSEKSKNVVIIDIDDKSINKLGQWPWSRDIVAKLINNLQQYNIKTLGIDIVFSEEDRSSPSKLLEKLDLDMQDIPNYDKIFASSIEQSKFPIVLGYQFLNKELEIVNFETPYIPAIYHPVKEVQLELLEAKDINLNIPIIQDSGNSSGFLNSTPDIFGTIRKMPLLISYNNQLYPSLALEIARTFYKLKEVRIEDCTVGINKIVFNDFSIPIDNNALININYYNLEFFNSISFIDIFENKKDLNEILNNKIVLIGSSASGIVNLNKTPLNQYLTSTQIQATILENILTKKFVYEPIWEKNLIIAFLFFTIAVVLSSIFFSNFLITTLFAFISFLTFTLTLWYLFYKKGLIIDAGYVFITLIFIYFITSVLIFLKERKELKTIKNKFAAKVSKDVMNDLLKSDSSLHFTTKKKEITIFFSDIIGFTKITNKIDNPDKLTNYLNLYMNPMTKIIMQNKGTVDKFIGDSIMAYWNAPNNVKNHQDLALSSALKQLEYLKNLNQEYLKNALPLIQIRIGINSGISYVGEMGADDRNDYTAIGKEVNKAAILEQVCKFYKASCIISQSVKENLKKDYTLRYIDTILIDGTKEAFKIYEVFKEGLPKPEEKQEIELFEKAVNLYQERQLDKALELFKSLDTNSKFNPYISKIYIHRITKVLNGEKFSSISHINKKLISN
ncbi:adenylate/guanylate cyclase domain-containing protein [Malaciobacter mytili]|uniref:Adenylate/guanylate cyclase domain-containing protein n=1 Tax=Malaciobacter mytili LMG 24559 TaxID=1032238 RepID=A0AAX2AJ00_9BACT|nr:adenylate/guanylate cyclase domain-containing protein [Malaciobacter mytili]AXH14417.1 CHASE2 sensor-containing adenylate/guanylate cyclase [Malaciobacter mytili LMG 24559]RXI44262.1 adenylate/guanylate cyclase domain-containing protein [Malaciobacter mytili]RXK16008.1 adenylate/guanylate cyclase domain-containing protein [Malaciobacter mytili LMG 24559]